MIYRGFLKRLIDLLISLFGLVILSPIFIIICFLLFISNSGKVFFLQERPGYKEKIFKIIKFKTMNDKRDKLGHLLSDKERMSYLGSIIRKSSLDEIPQLINVIKGDMSLIGPRPLLIQYLTLYNDYQKRRHDVKPGITGWAQVNGRNAISWDSKFSLDVWYVENISFKLDLKILFLTIKKVFIREGINQVGHVSSEEFKGNE
ncbi:sugar transferase [Sphingobacterium sp. HJSM2_6]|uniref:sugar transferase n=1 Tax=Sphingobacterium sp. HJSM2_6 TaxID=3366264 RepID=UPI003BE11D47